VDDEGIIQISVTRQRVKVVRKAEKGKHERKVFELDERMGYVRNNWTERILRM
jgi:hypothetical protein